MQRYTRGRGTVSIEAAGENTQHQRLRYTGGGAGGLFSFKCIFSHVDTTATKGLRVISDFFWECGVYHARPRQENNDEGNTQH